jgi:hypothetical protein
MDVIGPVSSLSQVFDSLPSLRRSAPTWLKSSTEVDPTFHLMHAPPH